MPDSDARGPRGLVPLLLLSASVVLVAFGFAQGVWLPNFHNGLLGLAFATVGAYVLQQRPGQWEGRLFLATGSVESVLFFGRQVGHASTSEAGRWLGWLGVWPTAIALGLMTLSVVYYPDGRAPSVGWRWVARAVALISAACAATSAAWPIEYASAGLRRSHPLGAIAPGAVGAFGPDVVHTVYVGLQVLWVVALIARFRTARGPVRRQLAWVLGAAGASVCALIVGLAVWHSPTPGLIAAAVVPAVAGWAIVHREHLVAYSALSWLSRTPARSDDLASDLARTVGEALAADSAILWVGRRELHAVGVWPPTSDTIPPTATSTLLESSDVHALAVSDHGTVIGAISVDRDPALGLSSAERRLFHDLVSQAALVIDHLGLSATVARRRQASQLHELTDRERTVLELMSRGLSNAAICAELHLSIKTVEPVVSSIFLKLRLPSDARGNRRVLAVLTYLQT